ncbi:UNVERIFIED_CONTAM: hypothetical protein GTU68_036096 [Idotea baltica]|nr:hypothetical protein [Idotea baltica]
MADYLESVEKHPVKSQVSPGEIYDQIPASAPEEGTSMKAIFQDFEKIILPGITHWQSPNFFAYFPGNGSYPSVLAEMLTATLGTQCMIWETSPAAAELEERMMNWLMKLMGIPSDWSGVIQSTASDATLCAILSAREAATSFEINANGFSGETTFRVYASSQTHSSIEKGVKIAGIGKENMVKIGVDKAYAMNPALLEQAIQSDIAAGKKPLCVVASLGTTSSTAVDPLEPIAEICEKYDVWLHVDAAFAGTAMILPEYQHYLKGIESADSFVFNPHKWMFTNFDCSAYFVKDEAALVQTFEILPEYLKTRHGHQVNNYRDWGIPLGRRFRALKLWFVLRSFGVEEIRKKIRTHIHTIQHLAKQIAASPDFELMAPTPFNMVCFRYHPENAAHDQLEQLNSSIVQTLNDSGKIYLTHTKLDGEYTIRLVAGQTQVTPLHVENAWELIQEVARGI